MSDPLANFFAKKDKKKSARKSTDSKPDEAKPSKEKKSTVGLNLRMLEQDDGEWEEYEDDREKDYSNLKIQTLTLKDREEEFREQKQLEAQLAREQVEGGSRGPWMRKNVNLQKETEKEAESKPEEPKETKEVKKELEPIQPARYIPPSLRQAQTQVQPLRAKKSAPEINNESEFPTLG